MKIFTDTYAKTGTLHHAYLIEGDKTVLLPQLIDFFEKDLKINIQGNPDFSVDYFETFTIDDGRNLQERQLKRALQDRKIYILAMQFITPEAQNSLLKVFEEPTEGTHFFVIIPNSQVILPTLRSRFIAVSSDRKEKSTNADLAREFMKASPAKRLVMMKNIVEEKDKGAAISFVEEIERIAAGSELTVARAKVLEEIITAKKYLHDRAPSIKLILEHLALLLP